MQGILKFNLPEERSEFELAVQAGKLHSALFDIAQEVFRPHRKHGYHDPDLTKMCEENQEVYDAIEKLEKMFYKILSDHNINLYD